MSKVTNHQIFIIVSGLILSTLSIFFIPSGYTTANANFEILSKINPIILFSFLLISTLGISHGALDGKIIWMSGNKADAFKLYSLYIIISLAGLLLWYLLPSLGLLTLLIMSIIHFGQSDLLFLKKNYKYVKCSWGLVMTLLPILFHPTIVGEIFYLLTNNERIFSLFGFVQILILINIVFLTSNFLLNFMRQKKGVYILLIGELMIMTVSAYLLHPLVWFAFYFCFLHGIRALVNYNFKLIPDVFWLFIFTLPIIILILSFNLERDNVNLLLIFPVIAGLTISHMLLPRLIKPIKLNKKKSTQIDS